MLSLPVHTRKSALKGKSIDSAGKIQFTHQYLPIARKMFHNQCFCTNDGYAKTPDVATFLSFFMLNFHFYVVTMLLLCSGWIKEQKQLSWGEEKIVFWLIIQALVTTDTAGCVLTSRQQYSAFVTTNTARKICC